MPIYQYTCSICKHSFELRQGFDALSEQACPKCTGKAKRQFHPAAIVFKGSGFYTTDYKRASSTVAPSDTKEPQSDSKEKQENKPANQEKASPEKSEQKET